MPTLKIMNEEATPGVWGQFSPRVGPFQTVANSLWKKDRKEGIKTLDTSHEMSALQEESPKRLARFTHAADAAFAESLVNAYRRGELVSTETRNIEVHNAALRKAAVICNQSYGGTIGDVHKAIIGLMEGENMKTDDMLPSQRLRDQIRELKAELSETKKAVTDMETRALAAEADNKALADALAPFAKLADEKPVKNARKARKGYIHAVLSIKDLDRARDNKEGTT